MVVGFARLDGRLVGIVANQPKVRGGAIFVDSADKAARFITLCDAFNVPLVFLHDVPGFMVGVAVERQGIIRHGAKMIAAMSSAEVPKFSRRAAQGLRRRLLRHVRARLRAARDASPCPPPRIAAMARRGRRQRHVREPRSPSIEDPRTSARPTWPRGAPSTRPTSTCCAWAASSSSTPSSSPAALRAELIARLAAADGWERTPGRRHHVVSPV